MNSKSKHQNRYTEEELLNELRNFYITENRIPIFKDFVGRQPGGTTFRSRFGSWNKALGKAGISLNQKKYTDDQLINDLVNFYKENGRSPSESDYYTRQPSISTYRYHFGTWSNALKKAELNSNKINYTKEFLIDELQRFYKENNRVPIYNDFTNNPLYPSFSVYSRKFNSWNDALKLAGLKVNRQKLNHQEFVKIIYDLVGNEYQVLSKYINSETRIQLKHNICNYEYKVSPLHFIHNNSRCPKCARVMKSNTEIFKRQIFEIVNDEYSVLEEYKGNKRKILMKHNVCGYEWKVKPNNFLGGTRCPECFGGVIKLPEQFNKEFLDLAGNEYTLLDNYINTKTKLKVKHNLCNNEYLVAPCDFLSGRRCPICSESKGEQKIRHWMEDKELNFKSQYSFDDLKDIGLLRFDFAILDVNDNVLQLIEYDGIGHYDINSFGEKSYNSIKCHDQMKNNYCKQNNIPLLRIPYWEFENIENIFQEKNIA